MTTDHERTVDRVIDKAASFVKRQLIAGNYSLSVYGSDGTSRFSDQKGHVFVGYYITEALVGLLNEIERTILLVRIMSEEREGKWGFSPGALWVSPEHESFVVDADDTAYVLRTLRLLGVFRSPEHLLHFYREPVRAFVTFAAKGALSNQGGLTGEPSFANNMAFHPEVNANVFLMLKGTPHETAINYDILSDQQNEDGSWKSYFYPGSYFSNPLFLSFICSVEWYRPHVEKTISFLHTHQNSDGSWGTPGNSYETALALKGLAAAGRFDESYKRGIDYLIERVDSEGGWSEKELVIWEYHDQNNDVWKASDTFGTLITSMALSAFREWSKHLASVAGP